MTEKWKPSHPSFSYSLDGKLYTFKCKGDLNIRKKAEKRFRSRDIDDVVESKKSRKVIKEVMKN